MKKILFTTFLSLSILILFKSNTVIAQQTGSDREWGTITTAVPFLLIGPDARSGGMGDVGAATTPDPHSIYWNASKLAFVENSFGLTGSYVPWLSGLVDDIGLGYVSGYGKIGELQTVSASLRYFSLGSITFRNQEGVDQGTYKPNEFAIDIAYARKLSETFSAAVTGKFIYSNLTLGQVEGTRAGTSVAADISIYYNKPLKFSGNRNGFWALGVAVQNIGNKISYTSSTNKDFIPTNLKIGTSFGVDLDEYNFISINLDFNKLLVPTPPVLDSNDNPIPPYKDNDVSVIQGMFQSFYDAPFEEEMQEIVISGGVEYWYDKQFALRGGYFYENPKKGNRQFFTLGAGLKYNVFGLDFSYLIATNPNNPLKNTLRFTLTYDLE
jgi:hypothetical protein